MKWNERRDEKNKIVIFTKDEKEKKIAQRIFNTSYGQFIILIVLF